jgi:hypothetical protein
MTGAGVPTGQLPRGSESPKLNPPSAQHPSNNFTSTIASFYLFNSRYALRLLFQSHFRSNPMPERAERRAIPHRIVFPACDHTFHRKIKEQVYFNDRVTLLVQ